MRVSICLEMILSEADIPQRIELIRQCGFELVEFWGWADKDLLALRRALRGSDVRVACFSAHRRSSPILRSDHWLFLEELKCSAELARNLNCPALIVLSNELAPDGSAKPSLVTAENAVRNLHRALEQALPVAMENDVVLLLEPLNLNDHPGYFLSSSRIAFELVRAFNSAHLKVLYDVYHMQLMAEPVSEVIEREIAQIGHFHLADVPDRHEPGTGTLDFPRLLKTIRRTGFDGNLGFEFRPQGNARKALGRIKELTRLLDARID